ncbi:MAG: 3'-5' exonuclease [Gammaproteobacteria bacterium]|nr:3'-5' exonuclease [Gammaproteobacteria bacterium]
MSLLKWLRRRPEVHEQDQQRLDGLQAPLVPGEQLLNTQRFVVVDLEATGLHTGKDKILSIGAVVVEHGGILMGQQFERTLKRREVKVNEAVLIHQIAPSELATGIRPKTALLDFLEFVGDSPLVAFHADFDQRLLQRELKDFFGYAFKHPFFDLAEVAPLLNPEHGMRQPRMDDWVNYFKLNVLQRHNAAADAMVTAELLLIFLQQAGKQGITTVKQLDAALGNWRRRQNSAM